MSDITQPATDTETAATNAANAAAAVNHADEVIDGLTSDIDAAEVALLANRQYEAEALLEVDLWDERIALAQRMIEDLEEVRDQRFPDLMYFTHDPENWSGVNADNFRVGVGEQTRELQDMIIVCYFIKAEYETSRDAAIQFAADMTAAVTASEAEVARLEGDMAAWTTELEVQQANLDTYMGQLSGFGGHVVN